MTSELSKSSALFQTGRGGGLKKPPTRFSPVTSTIVGISPQNYLTFSLNSFATLLWIFKAIPSASPKLLNFKQE